LEADWEFEIGADAPVVDAAWSGFLDLRRQPDCVFQLTEAVRLPALADALVRLNATSSGFWTAKCDIWEPDSIDPDEFDAPSEAGACAIACYIDLLPANEPTWSTLDLAADWCRTLCTALRTHPLRQSRADLIIRRAFLAPDLTGLGVTAYLAACGSSTAAAIVALEAALQAFVYTVHPEHRTP
jgi:hypothetical protein